MGFENYGIVSFTGETKAAAFVDYLAQGKVMATKCRDCGTVSFPPKMDCPDCMSSNVDWFEISGSGTVETYAVVTYGPSGFENDAPYTLAMVDFGRFKVFGRMNKGIPVEQLAVGMKVKVAPVRLPENRFSYEFLKV
jgi:uncharacterized protein